MPTPEPADLYEILQVHPAAQAEVIQAAYQRLVELNDPAHNPAPDAVVRLAEINRAYEVLSDPQRRAAYDVQRTSGNGGELAGDAAVHDVVRAKSFQLVDNSGQTRGEFSLNDGGSPMLIMNDSDGNCLFTIQQQADGSQALAFADQSGNARLVIGESGDGTPVLYTADQAGNHRFGIKQGADGSQILIFGDPSGNVRLMVGDVNEKPTVSIFDSVGNIRFSVYQGDDGSQSVIFADQNGNPVKYIDEDT